MPVLTAALLHTAPAPTTTTTAEPSARPRPRNDFIGLGVTGVFGLMRLNIGPFDLSYERLIAHHHGLRAAGTIVHVHQDAPHEQLHMTILGGGLTYRYYLRPDRGVFFGATGGYRFGKARRGEKAAPDRVDMKIRHFDAGAQIGHRWVLPRVPLSFVVAGSVGYGPYRVRADTSGAMAEAAEHLAQDVLASTPVFFDLELSLAYAF